MNVYFPKSATKALDAKLAFIKGKGSQNLANEIAGRIAEGNDHDRLAGLDRYGRPQTPVKPRRGKYKGATGPPLAPFGATSRVVANFRSQARKRGGVWRIVAGWENVVSKAGVPFLPFHDQGIRLRPAGKGSSGKAPRTGRRPGVVGRIFATIKATLGGSWFLPRRPIFGISPRTHAGIRKRVQEFHDKVKRVKK